MEQTDDLQSVMVEPGEYFIGDPCYFFTHADWDKVLATCDIFRRPVGRAPNGDPVLGFSTAYGDGTYKGSDGFDYGVDAGLIGLVKVGAATRSQAELSQLCNRVTFHQKTLCTNDRGLMRFGRVVINTRDTREGEDG